MLPVLLLMAAAPQKQPTGPRHPAIKTTSSSKMPEISAIQPPQAPQPPQASVPQASVTERFEPAPMPNDDMSGPQIAQQQGARWSPTLLQPRTQFRGDGFSYGSTVQGVQERRVNPTPVMNLKMPLY
jgi:hypothetical protein